MIRDYSREIDLYRPAIERAWNDHMAKHPIIECDLAERQVRAYPAEDYIAGLSERTREEARQCYERTVREGAMMLFIRDSNRRVLQSQVLGFSERRKTGRPTRPSI